MSLKSSSIQSDLKTEKKHCLTDWNHNKISMFDWLTLSALSLDKDRLREREIDRVREGESQSLTVLIFLLFSNWLKLFCLRLCFLWHWCLLMARSIYIGKSLKLMQSKGLINRKTLNIYKLNCCKTWWNNQDYSSIIKNKQELRNDFKKNKTVKLVTLSKIALPPPPLPEIVT